MNNQLFRLLRVLHFETPMLFKTYYNFIILGMQMAIQASNLKSQQPPGEHQNILAVTQIWYQTKVGDFRQIPFIKVRKSQKQFVFPSMFLKNIK